MPLRERVQVTCAHCGKTLERTPSQVATRARHFCDQKCHMAYKTDQGTIQVTCAHCGAPLVRSLWRASRAEHHFCGRSCKHAFQEGRPLPARERQVQTTCDHCGKPITRKRCRVQDNRVYCDWRCAAKGLSEQRKGKRNPAYNSIPATCDQCGAEIAITRYKAARYIRHFCSQECRLTWSRASFTGPGNPHWKDGLGGYGPTWQRQRNKVRRRDGFRCQHCGISEKGLGRELDVHHITPFRQFGVERHEDANHLSNLICLCPRCHRSAEAGKLPVRPRLI